MSKNKRFNPDRIETLKEFCSSFIPPRKEEKELFKSKMWTKFCRLNKGWNFRGSVAKIKNDEFIGIPEWIQRPLKNVDLLDEEIWTEEEADEDKEDLDFQYDKLFGVYHELKSEYYENVMDKELDFDEKRILSRIKGKYKILIQKNEGGAINNHEDSGLISIEFDY